MIPYDRNVPAQPFDSLATSQPEIQNNFESLFNAFLINHISLNAASLAGNHTIVELLEQESALQTDLNELSIYTKNVEGQTDQVFMRFQKNGTEFQFTNYQIYPRPHSNTQSFFTFLPGNIIVYFGLIKKLTNFTYNLIPPVAKNIFSVSACCSSISSRFKPLFSIQASPNGLLSQVTFTVPITSQPSTIPLYYIIMANF